MTQMHRLEFAVDDGPFRSVEIMFTASRIHCPDGTPLWELIHVRVLSVTLRLHFNAWHRGEKVYHDGDLIKIAADAIDSGPEHVLNLNRWAEDKFWGAAQAVFENRFLELVAKAERSHHA